MVMLINVREKERKKIHTHSKLNRSIEPAKEKITLASYLLDSFKQGAIVPNISQCTKR